jgi:hypothetical protein
MVIFLPKRYEVEKCKKWRNTRLAEKVLHGLSPTTL